MILEIGFSKPKNNNFPFISEIIRFFEKTDYSHVYVRWYSKSTGLMVTYEASGSHVKFLSPEIFKETHDVVKSYYIKIDESKKPEILKFCILNAGRKYDIAQLIGLFFVRLFKMKRNPVPGSNQAFICSELILGLLSIAEIKHDLKNETVSPKDIDILLSSKNLTSFKNIK